MLELDKPLASEVEDVLVSDDVLESDEEHELDSVDVLESEDEDVLVSLDVLDSEDEVVLVSSDVSENVEDSQQSDEESVLESDRNISDDLQTQQQFEYAVQFPVGTSASDSDDFDGDL